MKVLITSPSLDEKDNVSGIAAVLRAVMARSKAEFDHFTAGRRDGESFNPSWILRQLALPVGFLRRIRRTKPDIVHINTSLVPLAIFRDLALAAAARFSKVPILLHIHGGPFVDKGFGNLAIGAAAKRLLRTANVIVVLSEIESTSLLARLPGLTIRVLPNAIPTDEIPHSERPEKKKTIVFLGRFHESKGLNEITEVCRELLNQGIDFHFTCYGAGPGQETFISDMTYILGGKFHFGGVVTGAEKWKALGNADIFLLPSKYEGMPIALLEAMGAGCVPVISATGSVPTVVEDGVNGFLINPTNISVIVDKLKQLLNDDNEMMRIRQNARSTILAQFNINGYVQRLDDIYVEIHK